MSFENTELLLKELRISNYKKFDNYSIVFDDHLTVLVGDNGAGKSTIIDAACVALGSFFQKIQNGRSISIGSDEARQIVVEQGDSYDVQSQYPVKIEARGFACGESIEWSRELNHAKSRITRVNALSLIEAGESLQTAVSNGEENVVLPVLARYGTDRLWRQGGSSPDAKPNRTLGYVDALNAAANESRMNSWFRKQSIWEWQNKKESPMFRAVKEALASCFDAAARVDDGIVDYDAELSQLVFIYHDHKGVCHRDGIQSMSDGYRGALSLIADIAYRMATLNPGLGSKVLRTPGIVLIDEIDLHLHPRWQARVLEDLVSIFPNVQFITTTHAPIVVSSVPTTCIRVLLEEKAMLPCVETNGRDASDLLKALFGASSRPEEIAALFSQFDSCIDIEDFDQAKAVLDQIEQEIGHDDPDVVAARTTLELEELLS